MHRTSSVQNTLTPTETLTKPDKSPVTIGDLSAQSLISLHLAQFFPEDKIIGEEDTEELEGNEKIRKRVVGLVNEGFGKGVGGKEGEWEEGREWNEKE